MTTSKTKVVICSKNSVNGCNIYVSNKLSEPRRMTRF